MISRTPSGAGRVAVALLLLHTGVAIAQPTSSAPPAQVVSVQGIPPEVLDEIVASARPDTPATLTVTNRPIATLRASLLGRSSADRAAAAERLITTIADEGQSATASSRELAGAFLITVGGRDTFALVPADVDALAGETLSGKANDAARRLQIALDERGEARRPRVLLMAAMQAVAATAAYAGLLWLLLRWRHRTATAVEIAATTRKSRHAAFDELARQTRGYVQRGIAIATLAAAVALGYFWLTFVLRRFPYTRPWGERLRSFLLEQIAWAANGFIAWLPSLFTVLLLVVLTRAVYRLVAVMFVAVEEGRLKLPWVYPETALSTRKLVNAMLWLLALIVSYPYLPGSDSDAFKGVSVFVGLVISIGSSGLVNQLMSGFTITYSRALRKGDFVRVGDVEGTVTHIGALSTKVETPRGEEITIPNAVLVSQTVTNFSRNADTTGVYTTTSVTIGYDAPWRQVHELLLRAASRTEAIRATPAPAVLQSALEDFYVRYTLLVAVETPSRRARVLDRLHANIQDAFNEAGVQIMSPNYEADPESPKMVPKERWFSAPGPADAENAKVTSRS